MMFVDLDESTAELGGPTNVTSIQYDGIQFPDDPDLPFDPLPDRQDFENPTPSTKKLNELGEAVTLLEFSLSAMERLYDFLGNIFDQKCKLFFENICAGGCVSNPAKVVCVAAHEAELWFFYAVVTALEVAHNAVHLAYEKATLGPGDEFDAVEYGKYTFKNFKTFDVWNHEALGIINNNILKQHTEMREQLEHRQELMTNAIIDQTTTSLEELGCEILKALGATTCTPVVTTPGVDSGIELDVQWPGGHQDMLEEIENIDTISNPGSPPLPCPGPDPVYTEFYAVCGGSGCQEGKVLAEHIDNNHKVRCCSDVAVPGWKKWDHCGVWARSNFNGCHEMTFSEANVLCTENGARLCTLEELGKDCTKGSGCGFYRNLIWSSTPVSSSATGGRRLSPAETIVAKETASEDPESQATKATESKAKVIEDKIDAMGNAMGNRIDSLELKMSAIQGLLMQLIDQHKE